MIIRDDEDGTEIDLESFFNDDYESIFPKPVYPAPPMPECNPPKPTAEEMLKRVLEFVKQESLPNCEFTRGMNCAKRQMKDHLEMLIKEVEQNG